MTRTIVVYGNHQAEALIPILRQVPGLETVGMAFFSSAGPAGSNANESAIASCLLWLGHPDDPHRPFPRHLLPGDCKQVTFAPLDFKLMWPWTTANPYDIRDERHPGGCFPYGDRVIIDCLKKGMAPADILAYYRMSAWNDHNPKLDGLLECERNRLIARDELCDVKMAELILANFTTNRLFWTVDSPTKLLFGELIGRILAIAPRDFPALGSLNIPAFLAAQSSDRFAAMQVPIHPNVAKNLGLQWYDTGARIEWQGAQLSYDQYFTEMVRYSIAAIGGATTAPDEALQARPLMWNDMSAQDQAFYYPAAVRSTFGMGGASNEVATDYLTPPMMSLESAQIEITTWCNFGCQQCGRTILSAQGKWTNQHIELEACRTIINTLPMTGRLILQGVGEPTMHPHFVEIVRMAVETKKFGAITFNTNGQTHNDAWWRELARLPQLVVVLSIDSLDQAVAEVCRANTKVDTLWSQLKLFHEIFRAFSVSMVASRLNIEDFEHTLRKMATLGSLNVAIQRMISDDESVVMRPEDEVRVNGIIAAVKRDFPQLNAQMDGGVAPGQKRCVAPFVAPFITVAGYLTPCCAAVDEAVYDHVLVDGKRSWDEIRGDKRVDGWVRSFIQEDPEICRGCSFNPNQVTSSRSESVSRSF